MCIKIIDNIIHKQGSVGNEETKTNTHKVETTYSVATQGTPQTTVASSQMYTDTFVVSTAYY